MKQRSLIVHEVVPFFLIFFALIVLTVIFDALLHWFDLIWVGRYLGIPGTIFILLAFTYSLRKRGVIRIGTPKGMLVLHQVLTLSGALMILVHAGIHVYTWLPWLALMAMLVNVISGLTGRFLLGRSQCYLMQETTKYAKQGLTEQEVERKLFWDATAVELMKKWRAVHIPITLAFAVAALAHIISIFVFWQWQ